jgi:hypothetical protein
MKVWKWRHRISISVLTSTGWDLPVLADDRAKPKICLGVRGRTLFCAVACTASEIQSSDVLLNGLLQKDSCGTRPSRPLLIPMRRMMDSIREAHGTVVRQAMPR